MEQFIGEIRMFGGNYAPQGWAMCNGQLLTIAQNDALYSLIGTAYGGDGQTTFGLPDLQGRIPVHQGPSGGVTYQIGQKAGLEEVTLISDQMPAHSHVPLAQPSPGVQSQPTDGFWAASSLNQFTTSAPNTTMAPNAVNLNGGSQPHDNMMPFQVVTFIIALEGVWPNPS